MGVREALTTGPSHCKCHHTAHQGKLVWAPQQAAPILLAFSSITHWSMVQAVLYFRGNHVPGLWVVFSSLAPSSDQSLCLLHLDPPHPASLKHHCSLPNSWHCGAVWFSWKSVWDWLPRFALCPYVCLWWLYTQQIHTSFNPASLQTPTEPSGQPVCLPSALDWRF